MIVSQEGILITQPQPKWIQMGLHLQKIPIVKDMITRGVTASCSTIANSSNALKWIAKFAKAYKIRFQDIERCQSCTSENECWHQFRSFNDFFIRRRLHVPARWDPPQATLVSPVDAYTVLLEENYSHVWIKGSQFSVDRLFLGGRHPPSATVLDVKRLYIFRLAPHHYHRFHSPVDGRIRKIFVLGTKKYSVDPIVVTAARQNVLTENVRVILEIEKRNVHPMPQSSPTYLYMAIIGATCVGTIVMTHPKLLLSLGRQGLNTDGDGINDRQLLRMQRQAMGPLRISRREKEVAIYRHEELGHFEYGGSTVCLAISKRRFEMTELSEKLILNTKNQTETEVRVGDPLAD